MANPLMKIDFVTSKVAIILYIIHLTIEISVSHHPIIVRKNTKVNFNLIILSRFMLDYFFVTNIGVVLHMKTYKLIGTQ